MYKYTSLICDKTESNLVFMYVCVYMCMYVYMYCLPLQCVLIICLDPHGLLIMC